MGKEKIIVALDVPDLAAAEKLLGQLQGEVLRVKVGLQLFIAAGPRVVALARQLGFRVFLDLKIHDIPNTAHSAVLSAATLGAEFLTVHCLGGPAMLAAAAAAARDKNLTLLGVTILTSMDDNQARAAGLRACVGDAVLQLAELALAGGLGGVVASPLETRAIRSRCGPQLRVVTPGIRPATAEPGDQKRVLTPREAVDAGSDFLVVGRPIAAAPDPVAAFRDIARSLEVPAA